MPPLSASPPQGRPSSPGGLRLDQALEKYIESKATKWAMSSVKDITPDLKDFVALVSADPQDYQEAAQAIPATALDRDRMRHYHKIMHHLPKRRTQSATYRGKTLAQLMALDIPEGDNLVSLTIDAWSALNSHYLTPQERGQLAWVLRKRREAAVRLPAPSNGFNTRRSYVRCQEREHNPTKRRVPNADTAHPRQAT